jgi:prepilin-type N-terminal cleavage/methylation domain-containing protein
MKNRGVTLTELIIVLSVIGILAVSISFTYIGWQGAYNVEQTTKNLFTDLAAARTRAMSRNRIYFAVWTTNSYSIFEDTNNNGWITDDAPVATFPKKVQYGLSKSANLLGGKSCVGTTNACTADADCGGGGGSCVNVLNTIMFNTRGIISTATNPETFPYVICLNTTTASDYNCIKVLQTGLNMGSLTTQIPAGGACDATNCATK